jgi:hypothetical protein
LDTGPVRAAPQRLAAEEQLGFGMVVADRFVATKQWRALALVAVLVLAVDLNELLLAGSTRARHSGLGKRGAGSTSTARQ